MAVEEKSTIPVRIPQPSNDTESQPRVGASQALPQGKVQMATMSELRAILASNDPSQEIAGGINTPTTRNLLNLSILAGLDQCWIRVGQIVQVTGSLAVQPTVASAQTRCAVSIPFPSTFTSTNQLTGVGMNELSIQSSEGVAIRGDTTNHDAEFNWWAPSIITMALRYQFMYIIL